MRTVQEITEQSLSEARLKQRDAETSLQKFEAQVQLIKQQEHENQRSYEDAVAVRPHHKSFHFNPCIRFRGVQLVIGLLLPLVHSHSCRHGKTASEGWRTFRRSVICCQPSWLRRARKTISCWHKCRSCRITWCGESNANDIVL